MTLVTLNGGSDLAAAAHDASTITSLSLDDLPPHDVAFMAIGESPENAETLLVMTRLLAHWRGPIFNNAASLIASRFAHVARRPQPSHRSTIEPQRLAEDVISSFSYELQQRSLRCELRCQGPAQLQGHPALLSQVMAQLLHLALAPEAAVQPGSLLLLRSDCDAGRWQCQLALRSRDSGLQLLALLAQRKVPSERRGPAFSGYLLDLVSGRAGGEFTARSPKSGELLLEVSLPLVN